MNYVRKLAGKFNKRFFQNVVIIVFISGLLGLTIRSSIKQDHRFGWHMFATKTTYHPKYYWLMSDNTRERYRPGDEIKGRAKEYVRDKKGRSTHSGIGAVSSWQNAYVKYMYTHYKPENADGFMSVVTYRTNRLPPDKIIEFVYPDTINPQEYEQ